MIVEFYISAAYSRTEFGLRTLLVGSSVVKEAGCSLCSGQLNYWWDLVFLSRSLSIFFFIPVNDIVLIWLLENWFEESIWFKNMT